MTGREEQVFLISTLIIGAVVELTVVAFILLTERFGARLYPAGGAAWRGVLIRTVGVISREAIESATKNGDGENRLREIVPPGEFPHVHADHSLHTALDRMGAAGLDVLPVVSRGAAEVSRFSSF